MLDQWSADALVAYSCGGSHGFGMTPHRVPCCPRTKSTRPYPVLDQGIARRASPFATLKRRISPCCAICPLTPRNTHA